MAKNKILNRSLLVQHWHNNYAPTYFLVVSSQTAQHRLDDYNIVIFLQYLIVNVITTDAKIISLFYDELHNFVLQE